MRRRLARRALLAALLTAPLAGEAQPSGRLPTVGYLSPGSHPLQQVFRDELRRLGYVEGASIAFEYRSAQDRFEQLPALAKELVDLGVDVIVAQVTQAAIAAKQATVTIPIVMIGVSDPVASGLVASLARPGGNVTGTSAVAAGVVGKQLELIRELVPGITRVAALWNPANRVFQLQQLNEASAAAAELGLHLRLLEARSAAELDATFTAMAHEPPAALLVMGDPLFIAHAGRVAELALRHRLPALGGAKINAQAGVLLTYGPNYDDAYRSAAVYVDRILKGTKPAELPVERSARFELIVNAKTARALGMALPHALLLRADQVIE